MNYLILISVTTLLSLSNEFAIVKCELYTSVDELSKWSSVKENLLMKIEGLLSIEKERLIKLDNLRKNINEFLGNSGGVQSNTLNKHNQDGSYHLYSGSLTEAEKMIHPIGAFITLHYITKAIEKINALYENPELALNSTAINTDDKLPSREDFIGSGNALLRLQTFYELETSSLATGKLVSKDDNLGQELNLQQYTFTDLHMNAFDCFELGKIAFGNGDYSISVEWFEKALELLRNTQPETSNSNQMTHLIDGDIESFSHELLDYLSFAAYKSGHIEYAAQLTKLWLESDPNNERALSNLEYYREELQTELTVDSRTKDLETNQNNSAHIEPSSDSIFRYQTNVAFDATSYELQNDIVVRNLCRSMVQRSGRNKCFRKMLIGNNQLSPELKIEVLHSNPRVIRILNVLTESEAMYLRRSALPKLHRSTVQSRSGLTHTDFRIAKTAWLSRKLDPIAERIGMRLSEMLELNLRESEDLQVVNYGLGGYYGPHLDAARDTSSKSNNSLPINQLKLNDRLATILIYLNHVEIGGATVFPRIGLTVKPLERSAVVWYNILRNGLADERTLHSGCPVLLGSKWIATFWPRERANSLVRPCGLRQQDE